MCDRCGPRIDRGIQALEAHANGEQPPPAPVGLLAYDVGNGQVAILTNQAGWEALKPFLRQLPGFVDTDDR